MLETENFDLLTVDGKGLYYLLKLLGDDVNAYLPIPDLVNAVLKIANEYYLKVYVLGATKENNAKAVSNINKLYPKIEIAGSRDGFFQSKDEIQIISEIKSKNVDVLLIGLPSPQKEILALKYKKELGAKIIIPCGGVVDLIAGRTKREPDFIKNLGLTWFFRLLQEPLRLFKPMVWGFIKIIFYTIPIIIFKKIVLKNDFNILK